MPLNDRERDLVQRSFEALRGDLGPPSAEFYAALFRHAPELRPLFREDLGGQGMKFMTTLAVLVDNLDDPQALETRYRDLGRLHAAVGVRREHFLPMEEALMDTLRTALGAAFDAETEAAWRKAFRDFAAAMIETGNISQG